MTYSSLAIIGTAGRGNDRNHLNKRVYDRMISGAVKLIGKLGADFPEINLISGGAAWADHIVVSLARLEMTPPRNVTLFLPTELSSDGFVGTDEKSDKTASTANYYHRIFSQVTGIDSIKELLEIQEAGAQIVSVNGNFFARNELVAKKVSLGGILLAYTFGDTGSDQPDWSMRKYDGNTSAGDAGLKDGGTAHTWNRSKPALKFHCKIGKEYDS